MTKYTVEVPDELWKEFKQVVTKEETMNEAINRLIEEEVHGRKGRRKG